MKRALASPKVVSNNTTAQDSVDQTPIRPVESNVGTWREARRAGNRGEGVTRRTRKEKANLPTKDKGVAPGLSVAEVTDLLEAWLLDGEGAKLSAVTLKDRRYRGEKLIWFMSNKGQPYLTQESLAAFMRYLGEKDRWGSAESVHKSKAAVSATGASVYYRTLRTMLRWAVRVGVMKESPLEKLSAPRVPKDQIIPLTVRQVNSLYASCLKTQYPRRNRAILAVLFDTGLRVGELCALRGGDIDLAARRLRVRDGKMGKDRIVPFGRMAARRLREYLALDPDRGSGDAVWIGEKGILAGEGMTPSGVQQMIRDLGALAGIQGVRVSPHTLRHTFAIEFLRAGGDVYSLQYILGHTDLEMTRRYVAVAQSDVDVAMAKSSPFDAMSRRR